MSVRSTTSRAVPGFPRRVWFDCMRRWLALAPLCLLMAGNTARAQNAEHVYDRLATLFFELDKSPDSPFTSVDSFSDAEYIEKGIIDERMQRWFDQARPLITEIVGSSDLPYLRAEPPEFHQPDLPNVYTRHRRLAKAIEILTLDARRREPALRLPLLRAQAKLAARTVDSHSIVSMLCALGIGEICVATIADMRDNGEIDRALSAEILQATQSMSDAASLGLERVVNVEFAAIERNIAGLRAMPEPERETAFRTKLRLPPDAPPIEAEDEPFSDRALDAAQREIARYRAEVMSILRLADPSEIWLRERLLRAALSNGEYGAYLKLDRPAVAHVVARVWNYDELWKRVRADLTMLAEGRATASELMDAGPFLARAADAAEEISLAGQRDVDRLRTGTEGLSPAERTRCVAVLAGLEHSIVRELEQGSVRGRARLDGRSIGRFRRWSDQTLIGRLQPGINGAIRVMLASAVSAATLDPAAAAQTAPGTRSPQERAVAAVRVAALLASSEVYGDSLAATSALVDALEALRILDGLGKIDHQGRAELGLALARFSAEDPIGFDRATAAARKMLVMGREIGRSYRFEDHALIMTLTPAEVLTAVAVLAEPATWLMENCDCTLQGPLLDLRPWFRGDALSDAANAHSIIKVRASDAEESLGQWRGIPGHPLQGLAVQPPLDLAERVATGKTALKRLHEIANRTHDSGGGGERDD
jgi:hypothetical protein